MRVENGVTVSTLNNKLRRFNKKRGKQSCNVFKFLITNSFKEIH